MIDLLHLPYLSYGRAMIPSFAPLIAVSRYFQAQPALQKRRALNKLRSAGITRVGQLQPESNFLSLEIQDNEHIKAVVHSQNTNGKTLLAATSQRVIITEKKPHFIKSRELAYDLIDGVSYAEGGGFFADVTLHTHLGDFNAGEVKIECAKRFRDYVELRCLEHTHLKEARYDRTTQKRFV